MLNPAERLIPFMTLSRHAALQGRIHPKLLPRMQKAQIAWGTAAPGGPG
jgi:hypothetical protein